MFPIFDVHNRIIGFEDGYWYGQPKYLNFPKHYYFISKHLYV